MHLFLKGAGGLGAKPPGGEAVDTAASNYTANIAKQLEREPNIGQAKKSERAAI